MGVTVTFQCMMKCFLSCDDVMEFDRSCQLSGSGREQFEHMKVGRSYILWPGNEASYRNEMVYHAWVCQATNLFEGSTML